MSNTPEDGHPDAGEEVASSGGDDDAESVEGQIVEDDDARERRVTVSSSFSGPLPPPAVLRAYDETIPGLAREIVDQWKAETAHRRETITELRGTDREAMRSFYAGERRGQTFGLICILAVLVVAVLAIVLESTAIGVAGIVTGGGALVWAMRRRSDVAEIEPVDLADGDELERPRTDTGPKSTKRQ
ncbi:MAG: DUF2335 domain-containing protein [Solirubrobacteraceae bacterium]